MSMKAYKPLIAAFLLAGSAITASSQSLEPFNPYGIFTPAVETTEMIRYGNLTPSLYTGAMTFSVPLYTYSDPDFKIPISLEYHFDGYRPGQHSGSVGYGWHLECGGAITREVRGFPDESDNYLKTRGWRFSLNKPQDCELRSSSCPYTNYIDINTYFSLISSYDPFSDIPAYVSPSDMRCKYDTAPDIYHFSFMGHSGDFYMNQAGEYVVYNSDIPEGEIRISVTGSEGQPGHFTITLGSGYKYEFFEYEYSLNPNPDRVHLPSKSYTGYRLSTITAPNDRRVQFGYEPQAEMTVFHDYPNIVWGSVISSGIWDGENNSGDMSQGVSKWCYTEEYAKYLNSITVDDYQVVSFGYETLQQREFAPSNYQSAGIGSEIPSSGWDSQCLSSMSVKDAAGEEIENIVFSHIQTGNGTPKLFLTSVASSRNGTYSFTYVDAGGFPKNNTENVDHWGYWNNRNIDGQAGDLMGVLVAGRRFLYGGGSTMPTNLYDQVVGNYKDPNWTYAVKGALSTITYPTGGTTTVEYEGNTATTRVNYNLLSDTTPFFESCSECEAGGVRVKSLTDQAVGMPASITTFRYVDANNISSGIINNMPRYCESASYEHTARIAFQQYGGGVTATATAAKFTGSGSAVYSKDSHVCYPSVYTKHPDGSKTLNTFTSVLTGDGYRDTYHIPSSPYKHVFSSNDVITFSPFGDSSCNHFSGKLYGDRSGMRGKPLSTIVYDSRDRELQRTEYSYAAHPNTSSPLYLYVNTPLNYFGIYSLTTVARMMSRSESRDGLTSTGSYAYNDRGQTTSESTFDGLDETAVHFRYVQDTAGAPQDNATETEWGYSKQLSDAVKTKKENGVNYIIAAEHYDYMDGGSMSTHPTAITSYIIDTPVSVANGSGVQEMMELLASCETRTTTFSYDSRERLVRVDFPGGAYITYSWTTDGKYIASKSVNADDNMIRYEWQDMVGLSELQDVTGQTETYQYDNRNRLMQRKDTKGNPTEEYHYHIVNE